jgi:type I restriction enzyme S subunit
MRPYLRAANVKWSGLDLRDVKEMNFTEEESDVYELHPGDVLVAEASGSADEVGKPAVWRGEIAGCCFQNTLIRVRTLGPLPEYLRYFLLAEAQSGRIGRAAPGVGIHHIGAARLAAWRVPVAPLPEQQRIVAAIEEHTSRLDAADASLRRARQRIRALRQEILFLAVAEGIERPLDELLDGIEAGKSFKCHGRRADPDEWGVIKVSAMTWGRFNESENKAVIDKSRVDPRWEIKPGDLLLSRANTTDYVGATVLVTSCRSRLLLSDKSMRLLVRADTDKAWLQQALSARESRAQMSAVATGTSDSMRNISQEKVRAVRLRVPTLKRQREIAAKVDHGLSIAEALEAQVDRTLRRSAGLRRSILENAFSGELVPQDPSDEPASVLVERIAPKRAAGPKPTRTRRMRTPA